MADITRNSAKWPAQDAKRRAPMLDLDRLEALLAKATPGEWKIGVRRDQSIWLSIGDPFRGPHYQGDLVATPADAELIVAMRHALPALLQLARAVQNATQATVYTDSVSIDGEQVYELSPIDDHDEAAIKKFHGQTVALVPVPATEGKE